MSTTENRVLSVSYGSFSVKLEGFDDPFSIMRRVTEYFRSIAAVDPTFGQKPLIEDLDGLEALETAGFNDDVSLETEGATITLRPKELEVPSDVFVLGSTDLAPADEVFDDNASSNTDMTQDMDTEQQVAMVNTPLDLREMAQNHKEMPFVGKGPQALDDTPSEQSSEDVTPLDEPETEEIVQVAIDEAEIKQDVTVETIKKYRSLSLSDFEPAPQAVSQAPETETDATDDIKAVIAALSENETQTASEPAQAEEASVIVEEAVAPEPIAEKTDVAEEFANQAVDLRNQEPVEKRSLRIIRSEYAYEEPEELETPTTIPEAPSISVNPFRKFPKRETEAAPAPIAKQPKAEKAALPDDDFIFTYRKLRAEHG